ncbi:MAG TPA: PEP-CTERM sorting domain-containing protein [Bryobacteraceae bacterium]|nr:PEP-CTERM sorting domain-containing protein [Bryobacteraceae bacterium]
MHRSSYFRLLRPARLAVALLAFAAFASADSTITAPGVDWSLGENIWVNAGGTPEQTYFSGLIYIDLTQNGQQFDRDTLCVDFYTDIYIGENYDTLVVDPSAVPGRNLGQVAWLIDNALLPGQNQQNQSVLPQADWVTTPAQGAGIQLAIWNITTNGSVTSLTPTSPNNPYGYETDPAAATWASTYEQVSAGHTSNQAFVYQNWNPANGAPAQMLEGPVFKDNGPAPAPEPLTYVLVGTTLVGFGLRRRMVR